MLAGELIAVLVAVGWDLGGGDCVVGVVVGVVGDVVGLCLHSCCGGLAAPGLGGG